MLDGNKFKKLSEAKLVSLGGSDVCGECDAHRFELLVAGCWLLVAGCWLLVAGRGATLGKPRLAHQWDHVGLSRDASDGLRVAPVEYLDVVMLRWSCVRSPRLISMERVRLVGGS
jgi:hypothetical protein